MEHFYYFSICDLDRDVGSQLLGGVYTKSTSTSLDEVAEKVIKVLDLEGRALDILGGEVLPEVLNGAPLNKLLRYDELVGTLASVDEMIAGAELDRFLDENDGDDDLTPEEEAFFNDFVKLLGAKIFPEKEVSHD